MALSVSLAVLDDIGTEDLEICLISRAWQRGPVTVALAERAGDAGRLFVGPRLVFLLRSRHPRPTSNVPSGCVLELSPVLPGSRRPGPLHHGPVLLLNTHTLSNSHRSLFHYLLLLITMDRNAFSFTTHTDDSDAADRKRLDSFKLGSVAPRTLNRCSAPVLHARSHSRKDSSISSLPSSISLPHVPLNPIADTPAAALQGSSSSKRNSHHRRRSSVSTRHESAEIMGVSLPSVPLSLSDDNINLGDKDSIRRRALWTLEGKTDVGSFSKVEIPELGAAETKKSFDFRAYH